MERAGARTVCVTVERHGDGEDDDGASDLDGRSGRGAVMMLVRGRGRGRGVASGLVGRSCSFGLGGVESLVPVVGYA